MKLYYSMRMRLKLVRRLIIFISSITLISLILFVFFQFYNSKNAFAFAAGEYRSKSTGNWNAISTWETYNGSSWVNASATPTSADNIITIQSAHLITVTANVTADQVVINGNGQININNGVVLTIANGAGIDIDLSGKLSNAGSLTFNAGVTMSVQSGGTYEHNQNTGNIPLATWNTGSTCALTGVTVTLPANISQSFYNLTYNCPNQTSVENTGANLTTVNGDFNIISTGTGALRFGPSNLFTFNVGGNMNQTGGNLYLTGSNNPTFNISGNFNFSGGFCAFTDASNSSGNGTPVMNVYGNFNFSGGTIEMSQFASNTSGKGIGTMNLYGNYNQTGGTLSESANTLAASGYGKINFAKSGTQIFYRNSGTIINTIHFTVNSGSILDMGISYPTGNGTFTVVAGGALIMAAPEGITQTSLLGNVQVTGTRTFSTSANYTYNASSAQVTGDGLPATVNNLTGDNNSNVTLTNTVSVSGILSLTNGKIITSSNELFVTNSATGSINGHNTSNYIIGNLRRNINSSGSYDFPLGTLSNYELINVTTSSIAGTSNILGNFVNINPIENSYQLSGITINGTTVDSMLNYGYWSLTPNASLTSGTYSVTLKETGFTNPASSAASYCVLKRSGLGNSWQSLGTHNSSTQTESGGIATAVRSSLSSFSHFAIGKYSGASGLPIKLIYFKAKYIDNNVELSWSTASEINNDFFTIERSSDGIHFESILAKRGAGNSTTLLNYTDVDIQPLTGNSFYRLKQTDYDGHFSYSDIKAVKSKSNDFEQSNLKIVSFMPNPFWDHFQITFSVKQAGDLEIRLNNISGISLFKDHLRTNDGINSYEFNDLQGLPSGIYFINLTFNGQNQVQKVLKN